MLNFVDVALQNLNKKIKNPWNRRTQSVKFDLEKKSRLAKNFLPELMLKDFDEKLYDNFAVNKNLLRC